MTAQLPADWWIRNGTDNHDVKTALKYGFGSHLVKAVHRRIDECKRNPRSERLPASFDALLRRIRLDPVQRKRWAEGRTEPSSSAVYLQLASTLQANPGELMPTAAEWLGTATWYLCERMFGHSVDRAHCEWFATFCICQGNENDLVVSVSMARRLIDLADAPATKICEHVLDIKDLLRSRI